MTPCGRSSLWYTDIVSDISTSQGEGESPSWLRLHLNLFCDPAFQLGSLCMISPRNTFAIAHDLGHQGNRPFSQEEENGQSVLDGMLLESRAMQGNSLWNLSRYNACWNEWNANELIQTSLIVTSRSFFDCYIFFSCDIYLPNWKYRAAKKLF